MTGFEAAIPQPNRSIGEASDADIRKALQNIDETCVWTFFDQEFTFSSAAMVIARVEGMGAGFPHVAWALKYQNIFSMMRDWREIVSVPETIRESRRRHD